MISKQELYTMPLEELEEILRNMIERIFILLEGNNPRRAGEDLYREIQRTGSIYFERLPLEDRFNYFYNDMIAMQLFLAKNPEGAFKLLPLELKGDLILSKWETIDSLDPSWDIADISDLFAEIDHYCTFDIFDYLGYRDRLDLI